MEEKGIREEGEYERAKSIRESENRRRGEKRERGKESGERREWEWEREESGCQRAGALKRSGV